MSNAEQAPIIDIQVEQSGMEKWMDEDELINVMALGEDVALTGLKMFRDRGAALEMTRFELESLRIRSEEKRNSDLQIQ